MKVEICFLDENIKEEFLLTGDVNSNMNNNTNTNTNTNTITLNSPLGKAIYGKKQGDKITYKVNDYTYTIEILNIIP